MSLFDQDQGPKDEDVDCWALPTKMVPGGRTKTVGSRGRYSFAFQVRI